MVGKQTKARHRKNDMKEINGIQITLFSNVKEVYCKAYPTDNMGKSLNDNLTLVEMLSGMMKGNNTYQMLFPDEGFDSLVRERVFEMLAIVAECDYNDIYNLWLYPEEWSSVMDNKTKKRQVA